ncbi:MAG: hypothetical protein WCJ30_03640 [Deltaproteobacteria bacterium]
MSNPGGTGVDLRVQLGPLAMKNPIATASGTFRCDTHTSVPDDAHLMTVPCR